MKTLIQRPTRRGFTLVELLVSIGLTLFIMTIIVEAFTISMNSFQGFRAVGDLQSRLRSALQIMKYDLGQDHFEPGRRMSDANFWDEPRREGFFVVRQASAPSTGNKSYFDEGADLDGVNRSYLAKDHVLHFSNRLRGNSRDQVVVESVPAALLTAPPNLATVQTNAVGIDREALFGRDNGTSVSSQWYECAYFLTPSGQTIVDPNAPAHGPIALNNLYRSQLLVFGFTDKVNGLVPGDAATLSSLKNFSRSSTPGTKTQFFSPTDLAAGNRSLNFAAAPDTTRASLVCTNVVSFQVRILKNTGTTFEDLAQPGAFDSKDRQQFRVLGVQVILRVYDPASGLTRQATLLQDL